MYLHLDQLKKRILPSELLSATRFDDRLAGIAAEVAAMFDSVTGRVLVREVGRVEDHEGGEGIIGLSAYPVETLDSLTISYEEGEAFEALAYDRLSKKTGMIRFDEGSPGDDGSTIRATYTGGYWVDTSADLSGTLPDDAVAMPADLIGAWCKQVDHEARIQRVFGGTAEGELTAPYAEDITLIPRVERVLNSYRKLV